MLGSIRAVEEKWLISSYVIRLYASCLCVCRLQGGVCGGRAVFEDSPLCYPLFLSFSALLFALMFSPWCQSSVSSLRLPVILTSHHAIYALSLKGFSVHNRSSTNTP